MVNIGISIPLYAPDVQPNTALEFARRAEAAGAHSVWMPDRLVYGNYEPLVTLGAIAATTTRVRLGTCVLLPTLRPPTLLAKMIATLDQLSGGRVTLGFGSGSRADDFAGAEAPFEHRGSRLEELLAVLKRVWSGEPVVHSGRYYQVKTGPIGPRPLQQPHPPILLGGSAEPVLKRVARIADGFLGSASGGPDGFRRSWEKIRRYADEMGRDPSTITPVVHVHTCVDDDRERARAVALNHFRRYYGPNYEVPSWYMMGPPDECLRIAGDYLALGVQTLILTSVTADLGRFDQLCQEVVPGLLKAR